MANTNKLCATEFPIFVKNPASKDDFELIKKLLLSTTLQDYKKIDPLVIYLNILNFVKPGIIQDRFVTLLEGYRYETKESDFDTYLKAKYNSARVMYAVLESGSGTARPVAVIKDFQDLSEYDDLTAQHVISLFAILNCFIGWRIRDQVRFDRLLTIWMALFPMASAANQNNEGFQKLRPSHAFADNLHSFVALSQFRPQIMSVVVEMMNSDTCLYSGPLRLTWKILEGAGLNDFITVIKHIHDKDRKLYSTDRPKNLIPDVIKAMEKYKKLGAHCMLLNYDHELAEFKSMSQLRQYFEHILFNVTNIFSGTKERNTAPQAKNNAMPNQKSKEKPARKDSATLLNNLELGTGDGKCQTEKKIGEDTGTRTSPFKASYGPVPVATVGPVLDAGCVFGAKPRTNQFGQPLNTGLGSASASKLFTATSNVVNPTPNAGQFTFPTNTTFGATRQEASGLSAASSPSTTEDNTKQSNVSASVKPEPTKRANSPETEGNQSSDDDIEEFSEYAQLMNEILNIHDYNGWFVEYNPSTITAINTSYF